MIRRFLSDKILPKRNPFPRDIPFPISSNLFLRSLCLISSRIQVDPRLLAAAFGGGGGLLPAERWHPGWATRAPGVRLGDEHVREAGWARGCAHRGLRRPVALSGGGRGGGGRRGRCGRRCRRCGGPPGGRALEGGADHVEGADRGCVGSGRHRWRKVEVLVPALHARVARSQERLAGLREKSTKVGFSILCKRNSSGELISAYFTRINQTESHVRSINTNHTSIFLCYSYHK